MRTVFQRRHYEVIADLIRASLDCARHNADLFAIDVLEKLADNVASALASDNPRFSRSRFEARAKGR